MSDIYLLIIQRAKYPMHMPASVRHPDIPRAPYPKMCICFERGTRHTEHETSNSVCKKRWYLIFALKVFVESLKHEDKSLMTHQCYCPYVGTQTIKCAWSQYSL